MKTITSFIIKTDSTEWRRLLILLQQNRHRYKRNDDDVSDNDNVQNGFIS